MTNTPKSFQNSLAIETTLSDFGKICLTVSNVFHTNQKPHIHYRSYKKFSNEALLIISEMHSALVGELIF